MDNKEIVEAFMDRAINTSGTKAFSYDGRRFIWVFTDFFGDEITYEFDMTDNNVKTTIISKRVEDRGRAEFQRFLKRFHGY